MLDTLFPLNFSSSSLTILHSCRYKFFRMYVQHLQGEGGKSHHLYAGGLFAKACEITRRAIYDEEMGETEAIALGKDYILKAETIMDGIKTNERVAIVFEKYFDTFSSSDMVPAPLIDDTHAIEYGFELDTGIGHPTFKDRNILFTGKLDFVGVERVNGNDIYYVVDDKTTSSVYRLPGTKVPDINKIKNEYICRGQFIGYVYACHKLGIPVTKVKVRKIPIATNYEAPFEFDVECSQFMIDRWERSTFGLIEETVERYKWLIEGKGKGDSEFEASAFPPVYNEACYSWGQACPYSVGCTEKEGEEILKVTMGQYLSYPLVEERTSLREYLKKLERERENG